MQALRLQRAATALSACLLGAFFYAVNQVQPAAVSYMLAVMLIAALGFLLLHKQADSLPALGGRARPLLFILALLALLLRILLCLSTKGAGSDVSCFVGWAEIAQREGLSQFYTSGYFTDYPPGYIYALYGMGKLVRLLALDGKPAVLVVTLPALLCDILLAAAAYRILAPRSKRMALAAYLFFLFSPLFIYNSAVWKQVDCVAALFLACCFAAAVRERPALATVFYSLALLVKPQALLFGPVFALLFVRRFVARKESLLTAAKGAAGCAVISVTLLWLLSLPFRGTQEPFWLLWRYALTIGSYPYASVNAPNLFAALGGNYRLASEGWLLSYSQWGFLFLALITLSLLYFYVSSVRRERCDFFLLAGWYGAAIFTLMQGMHERYMILPIVLLALSAFWTESKALTAYLSMQSLLTLAGMLGPYLYMNAPEEYSALMLGVPIRLLGAAQTVLFLWLSAIVLRRVLGGHTETVLQATPLFSQVNIPDPQPLDRRDGFALLLLTAAASLLAFTGLGDMRAPESGLRFSEGKTVLITLERPVEALWMFCGIGDGVISVFDQETGEILYEQAKQYSDVFKWSAEDILPSERLRIVAHGVTVNELVFLDAEGNVLTPLGYDEEFSPLFDEQQKKPVRPSYRNSMYFDEIYHGRTAYEMLTGLPVYENTHPPLGKDIIMLGVSLFGMTPFGWRCMGALFGVLMIPALYLLARLLFAQRRTALFCGALFLFDFMRFTQTRIATIDSFVVLFILLSYLFMLIFLRRDFFSSRSKPLLLPLFFCGIFFGLGCAAKWTGIYAGAGLCFLFFLHLWRQYRESGGSVAFMRRCALLCIGCVFFFVIIPAGIYLLSYLPQFALRGEPYALGEVLANQRNMLSYHAGLRSSHPFASAWWEWPLLLRPVWYFMGELLSAGAAQTIVLLGNPAVWWAGGVALLIAIAAKLSGNREQALTFVLAGFTAQYLPWLLVQRETFLYHFFPALGFLVFALGWVVERLTLRYPRVKYGCIALLLISVLLFEWFYPALSGCVTTPEHIAQLHWLPRWSF